MFLIVNRSESTRLLVRETSFVIGGMTIGNLYTFKHDNMIKVKPSLSYFLNHAKLAILERCPDFRG